MPSPATQIAPGTPPSKPRNVAGRPPYRPVRNQFVAQLLHLTADMQGMVAKARLVTLFKGRASYSLIQAWRYGHRKPPEWAYDILIAELEKIIEAIKKEKGPR